MPPRLQAGAALGLASQPLRKDHRERASSGTAGGHEAGHGHRQVRPARSSGSWERNTQRQGQGALSRWVHGGSRTGVQATTAFTLVVRDREASRLVRAEGGRCAGRREKEGEKKEEGRRGGRKKREIRGR